MKLGDRSEAEVTLEFPIGFGQEENAFMKTKTATQAIIVALCAAIPGIVCAGIGSVWSGKTTVDTRDLLTGTIIGRVLGGGSPLTNANIRIQDTAYATNTIGDGSFLMTAVPIGQLYIVNIGAPDYRPARFQNVTVTSGTTNMGDIILTNAARPYQVIPLVPDVNPTVAEIREDGTAYRYYRVVDASNQPVGKVEVALRIAGGSAISQAGDMSHVWAGREAGVSDADGLLRLRIPATSLGAVGSTKTLEVVESGAVKQTFTAKVVAREYDQVWKHKVGVGVSGKLAVFRLGASGNYEAEVRHQMLGGITQQELITRRRAAELKADAEVGGGLKVPSVDVGARAEASAYLGLDLASTYKFDADSASGGLNLMKLYVALGDPLSLAAGPARWLYPYVAMIIEPLFLNSTLEEVEGNARLGGYAEGRRVWR